MSEDQTQLTQMVSNISPPTEGSEDNDTNGEEN
jgi:hypothetical protein